jgi:hypothetical protein
MTKYLKVLIVGIGLLMLASGVAYAVAAAATATITGTATHTFSITSGATLDITDPGTTAGPYTTALTGSPVVSALLDNKVALTANAPLVKVKISSVVPGKYGPSGQYVLTMGISAWTGSGSNDATDLVGNAATFALTDTDTNVLLRGAVPAGTIIEGSLSESVSLTVNAGKRLSGSIADSITITYTSFDI